MKKKKSHIRDQFGTRLFSLYTVDYLPCVKLFLFVCLFFLFVFRCLPVYLLKFVVLSRPERHVLGGLLAYGYNTSKGGY